MTREQALMLVEILANALAVRAFDGRDDLREALTNLRTQLASDTAAGTPARDAEGGE